MTQLRRISLASTGSLSVMRASAAATCSPRQPASLGRRRVMMVRAEAQQQPEGSGEPSHAQGSVDWDASWSRFHQQQQQQAGQQQQQRQQHGAGSFPGGGGSNFRVGPLPSSRWGSNRVTGVGSDAIGDIKRQESLLVNVWSQQWFLGAGGAAALVMLVLLLVVAGPAPADPRCTLPWC